MAIRDREWPAYTQWFCCTVCRRLWTYQGNEVVVLDGQYALGPASPSTGVPGRICSVCQGERPVPVAQI